MSQFTWFVALALYLLARSTAASEIRTVALSGQSASGVSNTETFSSFSGGSLTNEGFVVFHAKLKSESNEVGEIRSDRSIWVEESPGKLKLAVRAGDIAFVGDEETRFVSFSNYRLCNAGQLSFFASSVSEQGSRRGVWFKPREGKPVPVALQRDLLPGADGAILESFEQMSRFQRLANQAGQTVFIAKLAPRDLGTTASGWGLFAQDRQGELQLIVRRRVPRWYRLAPVHPRSTTMATLCLDVSNDQIFLSAVPPAAVFRSRCVGRCSLRCSVTTPSSFLQEQRNV